VLIMKTNLGDITIELFEKEAPVSAKNFLDYATSGFYDGTIFHRVIDGFMIQGGGFTADMQQKKTQPPIRNESSNGLENRKYTLAMARTSVPDSATCQFFINTNDNEFLDKSRSQDGVGYAVFGRVTDGQDIVDQIGKVKTGTSAGMRDVPVDAVVIERVERVEC
jgi:peptidyl-prolyl cis-trans isomerase B (cyclophilin B)